MIRPDVRAEMRGYFAPDLQSAVRAHVGVRHKNWQYKAGEVPVYWGVGANEEKAKEAAGKVGITFTRIPAAIKDFFNYWLFFNIRGASNDQVVFEHIELGTNYRIWSTGVTSVHGKTDHLVHKRTEPNVQTSV